MWHLIINYIIIGIITFIILVSTLILFYNIIKIKLNKYIDNDNDHEFILMLLIISSSIFWIIALPIILIVSIGKFIQHDLKDKEIK